MLLNKISIRSAGALGSIMVFAATAHAVPLPPQKASSESNVVEQGRRLLANRGARFVENRGQWNAQARFLAQGRSLNLWYTDQGIRYDQISPSRHRHQAVDMFFVGGHGSRPVGVSKLNAEQQVFHGNLAVTGIRSYHEVLQRNVMPGVDMRGYFDDDKPRYDLIVAPGTKPSTIALGFKGANSLSVVKGALKIGTNFNGVFNAKPVAYQLVAGKRVPVAAAWTIAQGAARFKIGTYDPRRPLVIDPLVYGTYFGGQQGPDEIRAATTDFYQGKNAGLFIVGSSAAPDFPGTSKPFTDTLNPEGTDAFVARIVPNPVTNGTPGTVTDLSVLIGGQGTDIAQYVKQNPITGDLYFAGTTISGTFSVGTDASGASHFNTFPSTFNPSTGFRKVIGDDVANEVGFFVGRFFHRADGSISFGSDNFSDGPRYAIVLGTGITNAAIDTAYMTGFDITPFTRYNAGLVEMAISGVSDSALAPQTNGLISNGSGYGYSHPHPGSRAGFLLRFQAEASGQTSPDRVFAVSSIASQYVVGLRDTELRGVVLDSNERAYTVGTVYDSNGPSNVDTSQQPQYFDTTPNAISDVNGTTVLGRILRSTDVFVRIYAPYNSALGQNNLTFSGLIGGNGDDEAGGVAASLSAVSVFNTTFDFPDFESLIPIYTGSAIAIDAKDNIYVTGTTRVGPNFPHTAGAFGGFTPPPGAQLRQSDIFVARLSAGGGRLDYAATLAVNASVTPVSYGEANFTTAMPAGIVVDSRGYVYVTGNLRPYSVIFSSTYTTLSTVDEPTATPSTIPIGQATNTIDSTYSFPTAGPFPSTEGFLMVLDPTLSALPFASYIGGVLDDLVYAPSLDSDGNVIISGWTDGGRVYDPPFRASADYIESDGTLNGLFISGDAVKTVPDTNVGFQGDFLSFPDPTVPIFPRFNSQESTTTTGFGYEIWGTDTSAIAPDQRILPGVRTPTTATPPPPLGEIGLGRDGFVARIQVIPPPAAPTVALVFNPNKIAPLASTTGTVTITPAQLTSTIVTVSGPTLTGLTSGDVSVSGLSSTGTLTIPAGSTTATFTVKSNTVTTGGSAAFTATLLNGSTASASVMISGEGLSFTVSPTSISGLAGTTTTTGTLTLSSAVPVAIATKVTVPNTTENIKVFPAATVDSANPTLLDIATPTIASGSASATFSITVGSPDSAQAVVLTATTMTSNVSTLTATATLTVSPVSLFSITGSPKTVRGGVGAQITFTVAFVGQPSSSDALSVVYSLGGALSTPPSSVGSLVSAGTDSAGHYLYKFAVSANRLTRSQDVNVTATYKSSTANTTVTVTR